MNKKQLIIGWGIALLLSGCAYSSQKAAMVADQKYYRESEGNISINIIGKFNSREKMRDILSLTKEIGMFKSRKWRLIDVLVSMDFNASGGVATWEVFGPKPLLLKYIEDLEACYKDKTLFYDFRYSFINLKPNAYREEDQGK